MNPLVRIDQCHDQLFFKEKKIAEIIQKHPEKVVGLTIKELAKLAGTSESTVVRFCQQIGYQGFSQLKLELAKNIKLYRYKKDMSEEKQLSKQVFHESLDLLQGLDLDFSLIQEIAQVIHKKRLVLIFGNNETGNLAYLFSKKLQSVGKPCFIANDRLSMEKNSFMLATDCLAIFISHSGHSSTTLKAAKKAMNKDVDRLVITKSNESDLAKLANYLITVPFFKTSLLDYAYSTQLAFMTILSLIAIELVHLNIKNEDLMMHIQDELKKDILSYQSLQDK